MEPDQNEQRYQELAAKWLDKTITSEEEQEFANWYNSGQDKPLNIPESFVKDQETHRNRIFTKIKAAAGIEEPRSRIIPLYWRSVAAAVAILFVAIGGYIYFHQPQKTLLVARIKNGRYKNDVAPAKNKVILTLANGKQIVLDSTKNGVLANQGITAIKKTNGQLVYAVANSGTASSGPEIMYNNITVPKGARLSLILPDGSKVWLNAQSSLRFPAAFSGPERKVELQGEAYFEVAVNKAKPFKVQVGAAVIQDLGTHFNVMGYGNESAVKATLLEGSVKVTSNNDVRTLVPGEQAIISGTKKINVINDVDPGGVVAWKNNEFQFDNDDLQSVMRQLERWYEVDVDYQRIPKTHFSGEISRNVNLSAVLNMLELTGKIKFEIDGKTLRVLK